MKRGNKTKSYSIVIIPDATCSSKEFVLSSKFIKTAIIAVAILLVFFGFILFDYLTITLDKQKMKKLERENTKKDIQISQLSVDLNTINDNLKKMETYKERIMVGMGLTSPESLREVGQGGPPGDALFDQTSPSIQPINQGQVNLIEKSRDMVSNSKNILDNLTLADTTLNEQKFRLASTPAIWPTHGYISTSFGNRTHPVTGKWDFHGAIDISTQHGNKIIAPADGTVLLTESREYYGNTIIIDHGFGYTTRYGHLSGFNVREGQKVKRFQVIGFVGNTGRSTGPHLHYEIRFFDKPQNPMNFILD